MLQCLTYILQDYGFDYSDDDEGNEAASADVENMYYTAKCEILALNSGLV